MAGSLIADHEIDQLQVATDSQQTEGASQDVAGVDAGVGWLAGIAVHQDCWQK